jgi:hypothetical protein
MKKSIIFFAKKLKFLSLNLILPQLIIINIQHLLLEVAKHFQDTPYIIDLKNHQNNFKILHKIIKIIKIAAFQKCTNHNFVFIFKKKTTLVKWMNILKLILKSMSINPQKFSLLFISSNNNKPQLNITTNELHKIIFKYSITGLNI